MHRDLFNDDDTFKPPEQLQERFAEVGIRPNAADEIVTYCCLSHRATLVWFALSYVLGYRQVMVYDGSWTEWGSSVGFPIATV